MDENTITPNKSVAGSDELIKALMALSNGQITLSGTEPQSIAPTVITQPKRDWGDIYKLIALIVTAGATSVGVIVAATLAFNAINNPREYAMSLERLQMRYSEMAEKSNDSKPVCIFSYCPSTSDDRVKVADNPEDNDDERGSGRIEPASYEQAYQFWAEAYQAGYTPDQLDQMLEDYRAKEDATAVATWNNSLYDFKTALGR